VKVPLAFSVTAFPAHVAAGPVMDTGGALFTVMVCVNDEVQPFASVAVTV
jgi:hypothetical protein